MHSKCFPDHPFLTGFALHCVQVLVNRAPFKAETADLVQEHIAAAKARPAHVTRLDLI